MAPSQAGCGATASTFGGDARAGEEIKVGHSSRSGEATSAWNTNLVPDEDAQVVDEGEVIHQDPKQAELLIAEMEGFWPGRRILARMILQLLRWPLSILDGRPFRLSV